VLELRAYMHPLGLSQRFINYTLCYSGRSFLVPHEPLAPLWVAQLAEPITVTVTVIEGWCSPAGMCPTILMPLSCRLPATTATMATMQALMGPNGRNHFKRG